MVFTMMHLTLSVSSKNVENASLTELLTKVGDFSVTFTGCLPADSAGSGIGIVLLIILILFLIGCYAISFYNWFVNANVTHNITKQKNSVIFNVNLTFI